MTPFALAVGRAARAILVLSGSAMAAMACANVGPQDWGTSGAGGDASPGGDDGGGNGDGGVFGRLGDGGTTLTADAACAADKSLARSEPLDMYIMLDQSSSMSDMVSGGGTKWSAVTGALDTFMGQPSATGISVGIQFFGTPAGATCPYYCATDADCGASNGPCSAGICFGCANANDSCDASDYAKPSVEIAPLPGVGSSITAAIAQHAPHTATPTSPALQGAVNHASDWAKAHAGHVVIDVLATDGDPTWCDTNLANIDGIAASGVAGTPKILTFVIGVGTSTGNLDGIAAGGGTTSAFLVDTSQNVNQQFLDALNKIRGAALGCLYAIPIPTSGTPDYSRVNVEYTPGGGSPQLIPQVAGKAQCPASGEAWYYDDPAAPKQIILCAATCSKVSADSKGEVDVLTGCKTVVQ